MTVRDGKGRWWAAGVGLGVLLIGVGVFLLRAGLQDADRWSSVFGVFLNIAGLAVAVYCAVLARRAAVSPGPGAGGGEVTNQIRGGRFTDLVLQGRDMHSGPASVSPEQPGIGMAGAGAVHNRIEDGTFGGLVIQGRDMDGLVLPPPGGAGAQTGQQVQKR
jgi:hypothetical protein